MRIFSLIPLGVCDLGDDNFPRISIATGFRGDIGKKRDDVTEWNIIFILKQQITRHNILLHVYLFPLFLDFFCFARFISNQEILSVLINSVYLKPACAMPKRPKDS